MVAKPGFEPEKPDAIQFGRTVAATVSFHRDSNPEIESFRSPLANHAIFAFEILGAREVIQTIAVILKGFSSIIQILPPFKLPYLT